MLLSPLFVYALMLLGNTMLLVVFSLAAVAKLRDTRRAREGLLGFGVPERLARPSLVALVVAEALIAALLAIPPTRLAGAFGALSALGLFTLALTWQLVRGRRPACACFGALTAAAISWKSVGRNLLLMALASALIALPAAPLGPTLPAALPLPALVALAWGGLSVAWLLLLTRQNGRLLLRIQRLEQLAAGGAPLPLPLADAGPLRVGDPVPPLGLSDVRGRPFDLQSLRGVPVLLLFLDAHCAHCQPLLERLRDTRHPGAALVVISESAALRHTLPTEIVVLADPGWSTMARFGLRGTPAAAVVGADGALAQLAVHGASAVHAALDQVSAQEARHALASV